jgi:predicted acylesterase/phospholipase RssA
LNIVLAWFKGVFLQLLRNIKTNIGIAIGSGGVYSAAGLGVIEELESKGFKIDFVGGASAGALIAAIYFLEGNATATKIRLIKKIELLSSLKFNLFGNKIPTEKIRKIVSAILKGENWKDGKIKGACFGCAFLESHKPVILTRQSGLSLTDSVLASLSFNLIEPSVKLNGKLIAHGGDPFYLNGLRGMGAKYIIEISPNLQTGIIGEIARIGNIFGSFLILNKDFSNQNTINKENQIVKPDLEIHPNLSIFPPVLPLNFSEQNTNYMIDQGKNLMRVSFPRLEGQLQKVMI